MSAPGRELQGLGSIGGMPRMSSDYEFVTHGLDHTVRQGRRDAPETNGKDPTVPTCGTCRDGSRLHCDHWHGFRDPDELTYGRYVRLQDEAETIMHGVLDEYDRAAHDSCLEPEWLDTLGVFFTPLRYPLYGLQQVEAHLGVMAPTSYVTNAAAFAAADFLRATSVVAYRTRRLQIRHPGRPFAAHDSAVWQQMAAWQPARQAIETAMAADDFGEGLTAVNLVLWPALQSVLLRSFGQVARANGDELTWLLLANLAHDAERNRRWSMALARYAVRQRPANEEVFQRWADRWAPRASEAVEQLGAVIAGLPRAMAASDVAEAANEVMADSLASTRAPAGP